MRTASRMTNIAKRKQATGQRHICFQHLTKEFNLKQSQCFLPASICYLFNRTNLFAQIISYFYGTKEQTDSVRLVHRKIYLNNYIIFIPSAWRSVADRCCDGRFLRADANKINQGKSKFLGSILGPENTQLLRTGMSLRFFFNTFDGTKRLKFSRDITTLQFCNALDYSIDFFFLQG